MLTWLNIFCSADSSLRAYSGLLWPKKSSQLPCKSYAIKLIKSSSLKLKQVGFRHKTALSFSDHINICILNVGKRATILNRWDLRHLEMFEDTRRITKSRKSKDRQNNGQMRKEEKTNNGHMTVKRKLMIG